MYKHLLQFLSIRCQSVCQQNHRTSKGASSLLELVKISEVVRAPGLVRAGRDEWRGLGGRHGGSWEPAKPASLTEPFVRPVKAFSSHSAVHCKTHWSLWTGHRQRQRITMNVANQYSLVHFRNKSLKGKEVLFMLYILHLHFREVFVYQLPINTSNCMCMCVCVCQLVWLMIRL